MTDFDLLLCGIKYGSFCHFKCTTTWLGILRSNTLFPHNVFDIGVISRFSALMAFDSEDIGFFVQRYLISIRISRVVVSISCKL
jgi:hypothetical protein